MGLLKDKNDEIMSDINITPLVDIMLVLLIIFMLVSSIVNMNSIKVELPHAATGENLKTKTISVMITKNGEYYLDGIRINTNEIQDKLKQKKKENPDLQVIISADKKTYHEEVVKVIDYIRKLDITKFAINVDATSQGEP